MKIKQSVSVKMKYLIVAVVLFYGIAGLPASDESNLRIIGGSSASNGKYPYMVSLQTSQNKNICGGSIINSNWILTAASCVYGKTSYALKAIVGTAKLSNKGTQYNISQIRYHTAFNNQSKANDIALLKIFGNFTFNKNVKPVLLANSSAPVGRTCVFTGWGLKKYPSNDYANSLKYIKPKIVALSTCRSNLPQYAITNANVCSFDKKGRGACTGDVGGPLVCDNVQYGVLSWGVPCAVGKPDVHTNVTAYQSWIRNTIRF